MNGGLLNSISLSVLLRTAIKPALLLAVLLAASISQAATYYYYIHDSVKLPGLTRAQAVQAMEMGFYDFGVTFGHTMARGSAVDAHVHVMGRRLPANIAGIVAGSNVFDVNTDMQWDFNGARQIAWHEPCHMLLGWPDSMHDHMAVLYAANVAARPNPATTPNAPRPPPQTISDKIIAADIKLWKRTIPYDPSSSDWKKIVKTYRQSGKAAAFARMRNMALKKRK